MKYCRNCGKELKAEARFCNACGTPVDKQPEKETTEPKAGSQRQPMSPKKKKWIIIGAAAIILLFAVYKIGDILLSKDRLIDQFEDALYEQDEKEIAKLLHSDDKKLEINKDTVSAFVKYYKENPDEIKETVELLRAQSEWAESAMSEENYTEMIDFYLNDMVNLSQEGKFLFYDKYELSIDSVYLTLSTNYKDTELYIDKEEVGTAEEAYFEKTYGPYVPGIHELEAKLKTDFVELAVNDSVTAYSGSQKYVNLYLDGKDVQIQTSISEEELDLKGKLYINGKDVGINPFEETEFGPVLTDGTMTLSIEAELPWGTIKTAEKEIDSQYMDINLGEDSDTQKAIMDAIVKTNRETVIAITSATTSKLTQATDSYKEEIQDSIDDLEFYEEIYTGKYLATAFDLQSFDVDYYDDTWTASVKGRVKSQSDSYYQGDTPELEEEEDTYTFSLVYDEKAKKWLVDTLDYTYYFDDENIKEVTEESPKQYTSNES